MWGKFCHDDREYLAMDKIKPEKKRWKQAVFALTESNLDTITEIC